MGIKCKLWPEAELYLNVSAETLAFCLLVLLTQICLISCLTLRGYFCSVMLLCRHLGDLSGFIATGLLLAVELLEHGVSCMLKQVVCRCDDCY